jgi:L-lysine 2,3-aminomutase
MLENQSSHHIKPAVPCWQHEMASAFSRVEQLLAFLDLDPALLPAAAQASTLFAFKVTHSYASRMKKGDPDDPLLLQVLPLADELEAAPGYGADPVGDIEALATPGVLQKYHGRALLINTAACAIHCRYCFRRTFPYSEAQLPRQQESLALDYIARDETIHELILSGGDPLMLTDERLGGLVGRIADIPHVKRLRIHSRLPIVLPSRITPGLIRCLTASCLKVVLVVHANHANEFNRNTGKVFARLKQAGLPLFNQSVLLKGVNDRADTLIALSETLFENGIVPYYLHLLDKVAGTAHFDIPLEQARSLHDMLRRCLPGYLVPRLVREQAGAPYKLPV